jgi:hypothetical protein
MKTGNEPSEEELPSARPRQCLEKLASFLSSTVPIFMPMRHLGETGHPGKSERVGEGI